MSTRAITHGLIATIHELLTLPLDADLAGRRARAGVQSEAVAAGLAARRAQFARAWRKLINAFPQLSEMASKVSDRVSLQIDKRTDEPASWRRSAHSTTCSGKRCCWCR